MPVMSFPMLSPGVPCKAILASLFLATRTAPPAPFMRRRKSDISATERPS